MAQQSVSAVESTRICSHMNKEHGPSLSHYLEYFGKVEPKLAAQSPQITNFATPSMVIEYGKEERKEFTYKFNPPMYAGQARKRLEEMHQEARKGLGLSEIVINRFDLGVYATTLTVGLLIIQLFFAVAPNDWVLRIVPWISPFLKLVLAAAGVEPTTDILAFGTKTVLLLPLVSAHVAEVFTSLEAQFRRFSTTDRKVRLYWAAATVVGGFPVWQRLRDLGETEEAELEKKAKGQ
ncbi:hypothetical protein BCR35DRAFT_301106 [Leucosporidium creatinivorum]|uniref:DUF2470 domain-containing protein n=1 Tax=Leucosporidium creatinivorum TaxID=106004 RepID=A0A1Y2FXI9_9BASI|nr:hypothetical protein BCR35DRAFT_301106 [Leucosporidium creatinivorum]